MPGLIEPETVHVDDLPTVWCPVQQALSSEERTKELEEQATASLLWATPVPEQILRVLLNETVIERVLEPPAGYDPDVQGDWNPSLIAFAFKHAVKLLKEERSPGRLLVEYKVEEAGYWGIEITGEEMTIGRI
jgi:hypothetical protein